MKYSYVILLSFVIVGCSSSRDQIFNAENIKYGNFATELHLVPEQLTFDELVMAPATISYIDNLLIFRHYNRNFFYSVYDANTRLFIGNFGLKGRGPNEFLLLEGWNEFFSNKDQTGLYLSDINLKKIVKFNLSQFVQDTTKRWEYPTLKQYSDLHMRNHVINDTLYIAYMHDMSTGDVYFRKYSASINEISRFPMLRNRAKNYDEIDRLWGCSLINRNGNKLGMAMLHMDRINIFDFTDPEKSKSIMPSGASTMSLSNIANIKSDKRKIYYDGLGQTTEYIFALYHNQLLSEWQKKPKGVEIHVFDWEGNPVAKLLIDEYLAGFCIDEANEAIYAFDYSENVYRYDISRFYNSKTK